MHLPTSPTTVVSFLIAGVLLLLYGVQQISDIFQKTMSARLRSALASQDPTLATECLTRKAVLAQTKRTLHLRHVRRLQQRVAPSLSSSAIHLDLLNAMSRVLSHAFNIAVIVQGEM